MQLLLRYSIARERSSVHSRELILSSSQRFLALCDSCMGIWVHGKTVEALQTVWLHGIRLRVKRS
jgi:hypothetical protein